MDETLDFLVPGSTTDTEMLTNGLGVPADTPNAPNASESVESAPPPPSAWLSYDSSTLALPDTPASTPAPQVNTPSQVSDSGLFSYSGSDIRVMIDVPGSSNPQQLISVVTLTVSIHREKSPARACGYINPKGYARGRRTIAGTIILTQFNVDFLYQYLGAANSKDLSKDSVSFKVDQVPPFNMTIVFADEYGNSSYRRLINCEPVTDGVVYSSNDMMSEQSITYVAADFTPLLPLGKRPILNSNMDTRTTGFEGSIQDLMAQLKSGGLSV